MNRMFKKLLRKLIKPDHCDSCNKELGWFYGEAMATIRGGIQTELVCLDCYCKKHGIQLRHKKEI